MRQPFERTITGEQFEAVYAARFERGTTYQRIHEMAADGLLIPGEPFVISAEYVGEQCRAETLRRKGKLPAELSKLTPVDAVEHMRRSLLNLWAAERNKLERQTEGKRDLARASQIARLALDIARLPGPKDARPEKAAGSNTPGQPREPAAAGGALMKAFRAEARNGDGNDESPAG